MRRLIRAALTGLGPAFFLLAGAVLLASCTRPAPQSTTPQGEGFAIYLTADNASPWRMPPLNKVQLEEKPLLGMSDIVAYDWNLHRIELTADAAQRLGKLRVPTSGTAFVACVDRQPIYWGAFWTELSSAWPPRVWITQPVSPPAAPGERVIQIGFGDSGQGKRAGPDPRSDARILKSLQAWGKLASLRTQIPELAP